MSRYHLANTSLAGMLLRQLIEKARAAAALPEFLPTETPDDTPRRPSAMQEFEDAYQNALTRLSVSDSPCSYADTLDELREAHERWVSRDPFFPVSYRWTDERDLNRFADFIEHIIDEDVRDERSRLASSAYSIGLSPYGRFNQEIVDGTNRLIEADMDALEREPTSEEFLLRHYFETMG